MSSDTRDHLLYPEVLEYGPRQSSQELLRSQIEADTEHNLTHSPRFRARLRLARAVGVPVIDLQRRTGLARQTIYNSIKRPLGDEFQDLDILILITAGAAQTLDALQRATGTNIERIRQGISRLHAANHVGVLNGQWDVAQSAGILTVTAKGLERLQIEIDSERVRSTHDDAWTVFVAIEKHDEQAIVQATKELLGDDGSFGVIDAHVAPSRMRGPELAIVIRATDSREAFLVTNGLWAHLRQNLPQMPPYPEIVAQSPPRS